MQELRNWTHEELPDGKPSAASYREGCRCQECRDRNSEYQRAYRASRVAAKANHDGTSVWHNHRGQPSKTTARRWSCVHPRCLALADLELRDGIVINAATGLIDETWGAVPVVAA